MQTMYVTMGKAHSEDKVSSNREVKAAIKDVVDKLNKLYKKRFDDLNKMRQNITIDFSKFKGRTLGSFTTEPYISIFNVLCSMKTIPVAKLIDKPAPPPKI